MNSTSTNIVFFGQCGAGKSSTINKLLPPGQEARTSNGALSCTFDSTPYKTTLRGWECTLWDTAGLDGVNVFSDEEAKKMSPNFAIVKLHMLVDYIAQEGVSLLVYVLRQGRLPEHTRDNYRMFRDILCKKEVPIVLVLTGEGKHEPQNEIETWWSENKELFDRTGLEFSAIFCCAGSEDKEQLNFKEAFSAQGLKQCRSTPWKPESSRMLSRDTLLDFWKLAAPKYKWTDNATPLTKALIECRNVSHKEAKNLERYAKLMKEIHKYRTARKIGVWGERATT